MIKKIITFAALFFLCAAPAMANDGGGLYYDNTNKVTFSVKTISENVQIGEYYMFTLIATNNTGYNARIFKFEGIFEDEYSMFLEDEDIFFPESDIVPPYSTVEMDFSYKVPENIHWYMKDNKYYVNLDPEIIYFATDLPEEIESNEEIAQDWPTNGYDVINNCVNTIPLEITNIFGASEIAEIESSFGEKAYYTYYESSDIVINYGYLLKLQMNPQLQF